MQRIIIKKDEKKGLKERVRSEQGNGISEKERKIN